MKNFEAVIDLGPGRAWEREGDKEVREVFSGERRQLLEIRLRNGAVLTKHKAAEPITVLCLDGSGTFFAGAELEESQPMRAGTLVTLKGGIAHELRAEPEVRVLVTKFKGV
jgi:quercetin dioxygenase-like cupin family protein